MSLADTASLAIDLGTTTIAASIIDDATGERIALATVLNPQRQFGADVVSRIAAAAGSDSVRHEMALLVNRELESLTLRLLEDAGLTSASLRKVAIAGNPAMEHLLLDLPVDSLGAIPFRPLFTLGKELNSSLLGWGVSIDTFVFPLPGGFVGGDLVAFLYGQLGSEPYSGALPCLFLDLGTNAEIALLAGDRIYATSAAAGPAFEGGNLSCGVPALAGAIRSVRVHQGRVEIATIADAPPTGLCGTGALAAIASLRAENLIDSSGMMLEPARIPSNLANRVKTHDNETAFVIYRDASREIILTQEDIRQVQFAKAAIRAGIEVVAARAGVRFDELTKIVITGSFGEQLEAGMLQLLGIASGDGTAPEYVVHGPLRGIERYLRKADGSGTPDDLLRNLAIVPLSGNPRFESNFIRFMDF